MSTHELTRRGESLPTIFNDEASYNNGLLKLVLPKTEEAKKTASKHIPVK